MLFCDGFSITVGEKSNRLYRVGNAVTALAKKAECWISWRKPKPKPPSEYPSLA